MSDIAHQIEQLKIGGYFEEASTMEQLSCSINLRAEWDYLVEFAREGNFKKDLTQEQLQALWTTYSLHSKQNVGTAAYDRDLLMLWNWIRECSWTNFYEFNSFMCKHLV